ncbi:MAG: hypothetical protein IJ188_06670 [Clostridia bacterium]|nr:hypothetical protein [Clostridia bacterium]
MDMKKQTGKIESSRKATGVPAPAPSPGEDARRLELWRNVYRFFYTFKDMENTREAWTRCMTAMAEILRAFENDALAEGLMFAVLEWIEARMKKEYSI